MTMCRHPKVRAYALFLRSHCQAERAIYSCPDCCLPVFMRVWKGGLLGDRLGELEWIEICLTMGPGRRARKEVPG